MILNFRQFIVLFWVLLVTACLATQVRATDAIVIPLDAPALDISDSVELFSNVGDRLQISTAPGSDGIVRRIEVRAREAENTSWVVFALSNPGDEQIDRLIVTPHYRMVRSGIINPDLGSSRIAFLTPSEGFVPEREASREDDVFFVTLDPGAIITFVGEMRTDTLPQIYLWQPNKYKDAVNSFTLYKGIVLGISGLLAIFMTILFVVKGTILFPATAVLAWTVLAYVSIDFGFWGRIIPEDLGTGTEYRAAVEALFTATLVVFCYAYLNLNRWHIRYSHGAVGALIVLLGVVALSLADPTLAAGIARILLMVVGVAGLGIILLLAARGYDRAIMLIPTWFLLLCWIMAAGLTVTGRLSNDLVQPALVGGLVLIVLLFGFTVMQHAFAGGSIGESGVDDVERRALAFTGAGDFIWDWDVSRDKIYTSGETEELLGLDRGALNGPAQSWLPVIHHQDKSRFRAALDAVIDNRRGRLSQVFRLRGHDGHYRWLQLRARPVLGSDGEVIRCVGSLLDVSDSKTAEERLLHDAVHDNLTGLCNRELFLDRLSIELTRAETENTEKPSVILFDLDHFKKLNDSYGMSVGDSILLSVARRLGRLLKPQDTLARISGDQFGILLCSETSSEKIAAFAEAAGRALRAPIIFGDTEIFLTASLGIIIPDATKLDAGQNVRLAELALYEAKRQGGDRIEVFRPALQRMQDEFYASEAELREAITKHEFSILYQPIINLETKAVAGFEALLRWNHKTRGLLLPADFIPLAERTGVITDLGLFVLEQATRELSHWQRNAHGEPVFVSVNVSSRQLFRQDLINDVKGVLSRFPVASGSLKLELTESLVMKNPEYASKVMERLKNLGAGLSLDDFGTGYSSLSYLQKFPFDTIKIDKSFVRFDGRSQRPVILRSMVAMAHELGMNVVAEGAESESDALALSQLGCEYAQGFLYGKPMSTTAARDLLAKSGYPIAAQ